MRIGELAARAGVSTRALRYYEEQGLLFPERTGADQRVYPESAVERVALVRQLFTAGLSSKVIAEFLPAVDAGRASPELLARLREERAAIRARAAELREAGRRLDVLIGLAAHPEETACPGSLDRGAARRKASA
ncbi:MerR family transcriptional regulator [Streptomyces albidoflavus]